MSMYNIYSKYYFNTISQTSFIPAVVIYTKIRTKAAINSRTKHWATKQREKDTLMTVPLIIANIVGTQGTNGLWRAPLAQCGLFSYWFDCMFK